MNTKSMQMNNGYAKINQLINNWECATKRYLKLF